MFNFIFGASFGLVIGLVNVNKDELSRHLCVGFLLNNKEWKKWKVLLHLQQ